jgi:hypothetical protein
VAPLRMDLGAQLGGGGGGGGGGGPGVSADTDTEGTTRIETLRYEMLPDGPEYSGAAFGSIEGLQRARKMQIKVEAWANSEETRIKALTARLMALLAEPDGPRSAGEEGTEEERELTTLAAELDAVTGEMRGMLEELDGLAQVIPTLNPKPSTLSPKT